MTLHDLFRRADADSGLLSSRRITRGERLHLGFLAGSTALSVVAMRFVLDWFFLWRRIDCAVPSTRLLMPVTSAGGVVTGFAVYIVLAIQKDRELIRADLNHQIRNALQPVLYRSELIADPELRGYVRDCIRRIEAALVENLGGVAACSDAGLGRGHPELRDKSRRS